MPDHLVVNHLTRMRDGHICVAGLAPDGRHVRPQRRTGRWERAHLHPRGPFEVGAVVELGPTRAAGHPPEECLSLHCKATLCSIFGDDLTRQGRGAAVPEHAGEASLGLVHGRLAELVVEGDRPRVELDDPDLGRLNLSLTDVRVCNHEQLPFPQFLGIVGRRLARGDDVILGVGLSRAGGVVQLLMGPLRARILAAPISTLWG